MERIAMSQAERDKLEWLRRARDGVVTQKQAAEKMGVPDRRIRQLLRDMEQRGDAVVVHGLRGCASNHKIDGKIRQKAMRILRQPEWHDFGPTFASADSGRCRSRFRTDGDHRSEVMSITIPA